MEEHVSAQQSGNEGKQEPDMDNTTATKAQAEAPEEVSKPKSLLRRLWAKKKVRVWTYCLLYLAAWIFAAMLKLGFGINYGAQPYKDGALETVVARAVYFRPDEYETVPTKDEWFMQGNKELSWWRRDFCRIRSDGSMYAIMPDGREIPAMMGNCRVVAARLEVRFSAIRQWFVDNLPVFEKYVSLFLLPFLWDHKYVQYVYVPADYMGHRELYSRIIEALNDPCSFSFKGEINQMGWNDKDIDRLCSGPEPTDMRLCIVKPDASIVNFKFECLETKRILTKTRR